MLKSIKIWLCLCLCVVLCLSGCGDTVADEAAVQIPTGEDDEYTTTVKMNGDFQPMAETERFALYVNGSTAEIAVENKQTGTMWYSNPQKRDADTLAQGENRSLLYSQVAVTLSNASDEFTTMYSWDDAVEYDQVRYAALDKGLSVTYEFGKREREYLIPLLLEPARMESIHSQLEEADIDTLNSVYELVDLSLIEDEYVRQQILDIYPMLAEKPLYMVSNYSSEISEFVKEMVEEVLLKTDYTYEEMRADAEALQVIGYGDGDALLVNLTVEYRLGEQGLSVCVPKESVLYDAGAFHLTNIALLPSFGALEAGTSDSYVFLPDGSGALLYGDGGNANASDYYKQVYGYDRATELMQSVSETTVRLPVFGVKNGNEAFLATIVKGDACAWLRADRAGKNDAYTNVYADFAVTPYVKPVYSTLNIWTINSYQARRCDTDLQIDYCFLSGEQANYTGMANTYRQQLLAGREPSVQTPVSLQLTLLGATVYPDSVLGIRLERTAPLTTYAQAVELMGLLRRQGVEQLRVVMKGGINGGLPGDASRGADAISALGGATGLKQLVAEAASYGVPLAMDGDLLYTTAGKAKGYVSNSINGYTAYAYRYRTSDGARTTLWTDYFVVSPVKYTAFAERYAKDIAKFGLRDSAFLSVGEGLNSDYKKERLTDRSQTSDILQTLLQTAAQTGQVTVSGGNAYVLHAASAVQNAPLDTAAGYFFDQAVPFYAIATRGVARLAGEPLNTAADGQRTLLKAIETGSDLSAEWMYVDNEALKRTFYDAAGVCYQASFTAVCEAYAELQEAVGDCGGYAITAHAEVLPSVYKTTFANGVTVYVNYTSQEVTAEGVTISANDWTRREGG